MGNHINKWAVVLEIVKKRVLPGLQRLKTFFKVGWRYRNGRVEPRMGNRNGNSGCKDVDGGRVRWKNTRTRHGGKDEFGASESFNLMI